MMHLQLAQTRCRDGMSLAEASARCFKEAKEKKRSYGWIATGEDGQWAIAYTTSAMTYAVIDQKGELIASSLDHS